MGKFSRVRKIDCECRSGFKLTAGKPNQTIHLKLEHFIACSIYLNKADFHKKGLSFSFSHLFVVIWAHRNLNFYTVKIYQSFSSQFLSFVSCLQKLSLNILWRGHLTECFIMQILASNSHQRLFTLGQIISVL